MEHISDQEIYQPIRGQKALNSESRSPDAEGSGRGVSGLSVHTYPPPYNPKGQPNWVKIRRIRYRISGTLEGNEYRMVRRHGKLTLKADMLCMKGWKGGEAVKRTAIKEFTKTSRKRFLDKMLEIDWDAEAAQHGLYFVTLTYPADFPTDGRVMTRHLEKFTRRLERRYSVVSYAWKKEYQRRGAPHYHLMLRIDEPDLKQLQRRVRDYWGDTIGHTDAAGRQAGTQTERIRKPQSAAAYLALYLCKQDQNKVPKEKITYEHGHEVKREPLEIVNTGRWWGFYRMQDVKHLCQAFALTPAQYELGQKLIKEFWEAHGLPQYQYSTKIELMDFSPDLDAIMREIIAEK